jgi:hypothetical protein
VQTGAQKTVGLDAALTAALEAAAGRVSERVKQVLLTARLTTAVHMRRSAELAAARIGEDQSCVLGQAAAPTDPGAAAGLMRRGGRP